MALCAATALSLTLPSARRAHSNTVGRSVSRAVRCVHGDGRGELLPGPGSQPADVPHSSMEEAAGRRAVLAAAVLAPALSALALGGQAQALPGFQKEASICCQLGKKRKVSESEFKTMPNGLKYYDTKVGSGPEAQKGARVAVHYVCKWKGVTFATSRQGMGVTGGTLLGFDVGTSENGLVLKGLDLGVEGMRVGGQRRLIVPPELGYGTRGFQELPPDATLDIDIELLSIKSSPFGYRTKLVEG
eukprot:jgi/Chlat1/6995/Chrsp56S06657